MPLLLLCEGEKRTNEEAGEPRRLADLSCPSCLHLPPGQLMHFTRLGELQVKVSGGCLDKMQTVI